MPRVGSRVELNGRRAAGGFFFGVEQVERWSQYKYERVSRVAVATQAAHTHTQDNRDAMKRDVSVWCQPIGGWSRGRRLGRAIGKVAVPDAARLAFSHTRAGRRQTRRDLGENRGLKRDCVKACMA